MKKANLLIALILALALAGGLFAVKQAVGQAKQRQLDILLAAADAETDGASSGAAGVGGVGDAAGVGGVGDAAGVGGAAGVGDAAGVGGAAGVGDAAGVGGAAGAGGATGADGATGDGDASGAGETGGNGAGAAEGAALSPVAELLANGDLSDPATLVALGLLDTEAIPALGEGEMTTDALVTWMQTQSVEALSAEARRAADEAIAVGSGDTKGTITPERRAFAKSQGELNLQAAQNILAEKASGLGWTYLECRDLIALQEENVAFCKALDGAIAAELKKSSEALEALKKSLETQKQRTGGSTSQGEIVALEKKVKSAANQLACIQRDVELLQKPMEQAEMALDAAKNDQVKAAQELNVAMGNPVTGALTVTGGLERVPLPTVTVEDAVAQAKTNRNEIKGAAFAIVRENQILTQLRYQAAPDSPDVRKQEAALQEAKNDYAAAQKDVEATVRSHLAQLQLADKKLSALTQNLEKSGKTAPAVDYVLTSVRETEWESSAQGLLEQWAAICAGRQELTAGSAQFNRDALHFHHELAAGCVAAGI